jgi:hypothetical protein
MVAGALLLTAIPAHASPSPSADPVWPTLTHRWKLNEGAGRTSADEVRGSTLSVSPTVTWVPGLLADFDPADHGLRFDQAGDVAKTSVKAVATRYDYSVLASLRPRTATGFGTAVSQDGDTRASAFELGLVTSTSCPTVSKTCFAFGVRSSADARPSRVMSSAPVEQDHRYQVTAAYDAEAAAAALFVCDLDGPSAYSPVATPFTTVAAPWGSAGVLRLGEARKEGHRSNRWQGDLFDVHTYAGLADEARAVRFCSPIDG